jgi:acetyl-CoA carboxylase biotin carboxyl carrier protein
MPTDIRKIKKLIELLETSGIAEIEIKEGEDSVRISRHAHGAAPLTMPPIWAAPGYGPPMAGPMSAAPPAAPPTPAAEAETPGHVLRSPMVGTFYRSPAPGRPAFVEIGQRGQGRRHARHHRGDEDVQSDRGRRHAGTVTRDPGRERQPVEFDQPLFVIIE